RTSRTERPLSSGGVVEEALIVIWRPDGGWRGCTRDSYRPFEDARRGALDGTQALAPGHPAGGALRTRRRGRPGDPRRVRRADAPRRDAGDGRGAEPGRRTPVDRPGARGGCGARRPARGGDP